MHGKIEGYQFSDALTATDHLEQDESVRFIVSVGNWAEVDYDAGCFPGEIKSILFSGNCLICMFKK